MWIKKCRRSIFWLYFVSMSVNVGMWLERFVIVVQSLHRDYLPSSWHSYVPTIYDWSMYIGTIAMFLFLFFLFIRFLPMIAIFEMRMLVPRSGVTGKSGPPPPLGAGGQAGDKHRAAGVGSGGAH
jgi:molybdopterin-containing oxidoreductase family membrane subunit